VEGTDFSGGECEEDFGCFEECDGGAEWAIFELLGEYYALAVSNLVAIFVERYLGEYK